MPKSFHGLELKWVRVQNHIKSKGFILFPGSISPEEMKASWPPDNGHEAFLDLAQRLGIQLIYAFASEFSGTDELLSTLNIDIEDFDSEFGLDEIEKFRKYSESFSGRYQWITIEWVYGGIVHSLWEWADWYSDLFNRCGALAEELDSKKADLEEEKTQEIQSIAEKLARDPKFYKARTWSSQSDMAKKAHPSISEQLLNQIVNRARDIYESQVAPEIERELADKARTLMKAGNSLTKTAGQLDVSTQKLSRLLSRYSEND